MLIAGATAAQQTVFDVMQDRGELLGWEAVGRVETGSGFCTGTLIGRDIVLTAAHCVYDNAGRPLPAERITFRAGYHRGSQIAARSVLKWVAAKDYVPRAAGGMTPEMIANDVALLRLDRDIVSAEADPFRVIEGAADGTQVSVVSYGRGREEVLSRQARCALTRRYRGGILAFDCDVTFGSSGAPVFVREDGRLRILSVISGGDSLASGGGAAYGMTLPPIVAALSSELRMESARPVVSSGAKRVTVGDRSGTGARFVRP